MPPTDPEHRGCTVTGRWVIVAPERGQRPIELGDPNPPARTADPGGFCPFCPGSEWDTPGEVYAVRPPDTAPDTPGWSLRVVPNKFPAVRPDAPSGYGFHEVLIDTPRHVSDPGGLSVAETAAGLQAIRHRFADLRSRWGIHLVTLFRNVGAEAGASLAHSHAQIIATGPGPDTSFTEGIALDQLYRPGEPCPTCQMLGYELADGERVVAETPHFVALCPWAARFDHEVWLLPKAHAPQFESSPDAAVAEFAGLLQRVRRAVDAALGRPAYNEFIRAAPIKAFGERPWHHWRLELCPRTARLAGFELATGTFILTVTPERSAELFRAALPPEDE